MIEPFAFSRVPRIHFGPGTITLVPDLAAQYGRRALLVTGAHSFKASTAYKLFNEGCRQCGVDIVELSVHDEPSPQIVDDAVREFGGGDIACVVGIGGGSALDCAKAIAGLLRTGNSVMDHLEGVGPELSYEGPAVPFIAVPTTAGTGSEATKNAVLSVRGDGGFKKSFRDERLVAEHAVVDPDLLESCPPAVIAANGMDALTQLLEAYVSTRSSAMTDALAWSGLRAVRDGLLPWHDGSGGAAARAGMAYAALMSGITLAQAGLGSVHGLASPLGALFPIPHGVVCGTLVAEATKANIAALSERPPGSDALDRYAAAGRLFASGPGLDDTDARAALIATLESYVRDLELKRLGAFGVSGADVARVVAGSRGSSMKTNPVALTDDEIAAVIAARL